MLWGRRLPLRRTPFIRWRCASNNKGNLDEYRQPKPAYEQAKNIYSVNVRIFMNLPKQVHLIMFMGQSNMAGRGTAAQAPTVALGTAYEFKAISQPNALCPIQEPFGASENNPSGVYEPGMKTGSMVSAFVNAFYEVIRKPIAGVSCSKGGSAIAEWLPGTPYYQDAVMRNRLCVDWLAHHQIQILKSTMVWCQGCTDGNLRTDPQIYKENTENFLHTYMADCGIDTCFLIQIGNHRDDAELHVPIQKAQLELAQDNHDIVLVSQSLKTFAQKGLMKDDLHYLQAGYNLVGDEAGRNTANHILQGE